MNSDDKVRVEVVNNLQTSFFVDAGAGAGKTRLMVDRIVSLLKNGAKPSEIVVITFTEAAAAELQERVADSIRKEKLENVRIDELNISTIHSFCNKLISMRSFDEEIGLSRRIIDEAEKTELVNAFVKKYITEHANDPEFDDIEAFWGYLPIRIITEESVKFADREDARYILDPLVERTIQDYLNEAMLILKDVLDAHNEVVDRLNDLGVEPKYKKFKYTDPKNGKLTEESFPVFINDVVNKNDEELAIAILRASVDVFDKRLAKPKHMEKDEFEGIKESVLGGYLDRVNAITNGFKDRFDVSKFSKIIKIADKIARCYRADTTRDPRLLTNDSLLNTARKLTNDREALEFFQERFKYFLVDEYQDTDDIQTDIIWNLATDPDDKESIRPGALVVVGDIKQAIYRFRGADSKLFGKTKSRMQAIKDKGGEGVKLISLTTNFRSSEKIIDWVNDTFSDRFRAQGEIYLPMEVSDLRKEYTDPSVFEGIFDGVGGSYTVDIIKKLTDKDSPFKIAKKRKIEDGDGFEYRSERIDYKDIMILAFTKTNLLTLAERLRQAGIPVVLLGEKGINDDASEREKAYIEWQYKAIERFRVLIDYLNSPYNRKKKAIAIQTLYRKDYLVMDDAEKEECEKLLNGFRQRFKDMQPVQVMGYFSKHFEILLPQNLKFEEHEYNGNREKFNKLYENLITKNCQSFEETITEINSYLEGSNEKLASLTPERNAVRIMNLHKAKGLEAPITILVHRAEEVKPFGDTFRDVNEYYETVPNGRYPFQTYKLNSEIVEKADLEKDKDYLCKAYVEATRAREAMIIMPSGNKSVLVDVELPLPKITDVLGITIVPEDTPQVVPADNTGAVTPEEEPEYPTAENPVDDLYDSSPDIKKKMYLTLNPSSLEARNSDVKEDFTRAESITGAVFGTVMHRCYELTVDRRRIINALSGDELKTEISKIVIQAFLESERNILSGVYAGTSSETREQIQKEYMDYLVPKMIEFTESSLFTNVICDPDNNVQTEYHFSFCLDKDQANELVTEIGVEDYKKLDEFTVYDFSKGKLWINGTADLVIIGKDLENVLIVDYKSDVKVSEEGKSFEQILFERYCGQLRLYKGSLKRVLGIDESNINTGLYSLYETKTSFMDRIRT